jgi:hypothetical protein
VLGHASVLTIERYLGCKQNLGHPVNDLFDLKMDAEVGEHKSDSDIAEASVRLKTPPQMWHVGAGILKLSGFRP